MYSNLTLYYLNQMGIIPLVSKNSLLVDKNINCKLIVLADSIECSSKSQCLFTSMMNYIGLQKDEFSLIKINEYTANVSWVSELISKKKIAVLALGIDKDKILQDFKLTDSVVSSFSLDYLVQNPIYKKKLFQDLAVIKTLLSYSIN